MFFNFVMFNHSELGQRSLEDVIGILGHGMRALGHRAVWDPRNENLLTGPGTINVIVEGFTPSVVDIISRAHASGAKFMCLATEEPTPKGFNWGTSEEMKMRQEVFPTVAPYIQGILYLVPGEYVHNWYNTFAPAAYAELGYAPTLVRSSHTNWPPIFDFGFYGSMSPRRLRMLKKLARRSGREKAVRLMADFKTQTERDVAMREAKVIVQLRKFDAMGLVSSSRLNTALCLGRPVIAEPHLLADEWRDVVTFSETEEGFYDLCIMALKNWQSLHRSQFSKFQAKMTPTKCVGEPLQQIGVC